MEITINWILILYILNALFAFTLIFLERKDPIATLTWVLVLTFIPILGFVFYIFSYQNFSRRKLFKLKIIEEKILKKYIDIQKKKFSEQTLVFNEDSIEYFEDLVEINLFYGNSYYSTDNHVQIFNDGKEKFDKLIKSIKNARDHIHMEYFIIKSDSLGKEIIDILAQKASQGVQVRLLYDSVGGRKLKKSTLKPLVEAGGKVGVFFKSPIPFINLRLNFRNHRKIVVIDGGEAFIGGFNIGDEYLGRNKRFGYWRDTHIKITGSAVKDVQTRFLLDWRSAAKENISFRYKYYPETKKAGNTGIQIVSSGPESRYQKIKINYLKMIGLAKKSICIQTPYFVPDSSI